MRTGVSDVVGECVEEFADCLGEGRGEAFGVGRYVDSVAGEETGRGVIN